MQQLEASLETLSNKMKALELEMGNPEIYAVANRFATLEKEYGALQLEKNTITTELEQAIEKVLVLEDELN